MERHTVRARWPAVGALAYWRLHLQSRFPHPQRLLEDVLVGPTAHPPRSGWAAVAAVRAFRLVGETGVLRGHCWARLDHRGRRWSVLAWDRRHLYRDGALPTWGLLPFVVGSLCGLISFSRDLGSFGAVLWALFGLGWAWLGLSLVVEGFSSFLRSRRAARTGVAVKQ